MDTKTAEPAAVRNVSTFTNPLLAVHGGHTVKVLAIGDQEGKSPVYLTINEEGLSSWQGIREVRVIDPTALPVSTEAFNRLIAQAGGGGGQYNQTPRR